MRVIVPNLQVRTPHEPWYANKGFVHSSLPLEVVRNIGMVEVEERDIHIPPLRKSNCDWEISVVQWVKLLPGMHPILEHQ